MVDVVVVGNIDRFPLAFTREMVDVVVVGNIDRYSLVFTREMVDVPTTTTSTISLMKTKG
jgi:hypothetical protein